MAKVGVFVGSVRERSWSRKVAAAVAQMFPADWEAEFFNLADLPLYNQDWDEADSSMEVPEVVRALREQVAGVNALLFVTPEYNRGLPGSLKNAIDIVSRPSGSFFLAGKPAMVVSISTGGISGFGANHALRQTLVFLNVPVMAQPELYLGHIHESFGGDPVKDRVGWDPDPERDRLAESTAALLQKGADSFVEFASHWL